MSGPAIVVVAAFITLWIAIKSSDGLVTEDYYRQGMVVGETLARSKRAEELGISASLRLTEDRIRIRLSSRQDTVPAALNLILSHPTRAGIDQKSRLKPGDGGYVGKLNLPASGYWLVLVEDEEKTWRIMGSVMLPAPGEVTIGVPETGDKR